MKRRSRHTVRARMLSMAAIVATVPSASQAQDANIPLPVAKIEEQLAGADFQILRVSPSRGLPSERTYQLTLQLDDGTVAQWKFAPAPRGGEAFNNSPQYELAPYALQKLFLGEPEYVVPPTAVRCFPLDFVEGVVAMTPGNPNPIEQTFREWRMTVSVLQYWVQAAQTATRDMIADNDRFDEDAAFARNAANFNLLTYLIHHNDSNDGNFLISLDPANPRIFSIDNGVAFSSEESTRGYYWRDLRFDRFPATSIDRLRELDQETLQRELGVLVQFEVRDGEFVAVDPTENLDPDDSIRRTDSVLQIGLKASEIRNIGRRITRLLDRIDSGRYETFP